MNVDDSLQTTEPETPAQAGTSGEAEHGPGRRLYGRFPLNSQIQICWEEAKGLQRQIRARTVDASKFGLQVQAERSIPTGTLVNVFSSNFTPIGRASVRHCTPKGMDYRIGLYMPDRFVDDL
jgi:hypothetical protein